MKKTQILALFVCLILIAVCGITDVAFQRKVDRLKV
jgi:hypothetical protein